MARLRPWVLRRAPHPLPPAKTPTIRNTSAIRKSHFRRSVIPGDNFIRNNSRKLHPWLKFSHVNGRKLSNSANKLRKHKFIPLRLFIRHRRIDWRLDQILFQTPHRHCPGKAFANFRPTGLHNRRLALPFALFHPPMASNSGNNNPHSPASFIDEHNCIPDRTKKSLVVDTKPPLPAGGGVSLPNKGFCACPPKEWSAKPLIKIPLNNPKILIQCHCQIIQRTKEKSPATRSSFFEANVVDSPGIEPGPN